MIAEDGSAWPWLWTVARNLLRDWQRREAVDRRARDRLGIAAVPYDEQALDELIRRADAEGLHDALAEALEELPLDQREAVVGRVVLGRDYARLSAPAKETAARVRVSRGLRAMRIRLSGGKP